MAAFDFERLLVDLVEGAFEDTLWASFLARLRSGTGADFAALDFRPFDRPADEAINLYSGEPLALRSESSEIALLGPNRPLPHHLPPEGKPYSLEEIMAGAHGDVPALRSLLVEQYGITSVRQMRVREPGGVDAWLTIVRRRGAFGRPDEYILERLAPVLRSVVHGFVALERERFATAAAGELMHRLQIGWFTLDARGHVLQRDDSANALFADGAQLRRNSHGRISAADPSVERELFRSLDHFAANPQGRARALCISREPWVDLLILPARTWRLGDPKATVVVYVQRDAVHASDRCELLAELFGLAPREAKLALALSRGMTIAEAAGHLGLKENSARMYTKSIYSKTGARGLADLVRIVTRGAMALSA